MISYKRRLAFFIISIVVLIATAFVSYKHPFQEKAYLHIADTDGMSFSEPPGFYDEPFYLTIDAPYDEIYYTLDGSEPDKESMRYDSPIYVYDRSADPNTNSMRDDVSIFFDDEKSELYRMCNVKEAVIPKYVPPKDNVSKCTTIKVAYYDKKGNRSRTVTGTYFVGQNRKDDETMIMSVVMDPGDLFDHDRGIYVMGKRGEEFWENVEKVTDDERQEMLTGRLDANYFGAGRDWEREAVCQLFKKGELTLNQKVGVRIQGGYSREFTPKSLRLYARQEYDGNKVIRTETDESLCMDKLVLYNGGEDIYTKIKDPLMSDICKDMDFVATEYKPCKLYLNGEYWGYYFLTDRYDRRYMHVRYGVDDDNVVLTKYGVLKEGTEKDLAGYEADMAFISTADMTDPANYEKAGEIVDIESFIDYFAAEIYIARWHDWPSNNYALWKTRRRDSGEYGDCRWRFILFDVNWGGMTYKDGDATRDTIALTRQESPIFDNMLNNPGFRKAFIARLESMREHEFAPERVSRMIDEYDTMMEGDIEEHFERFYGTDASRHYEEMEELKRFFNERHEYIPLMIEDNFGEAADYPGVVD